jgi:Na+-translocating membrane potential-generating system (MpsC)
MRMQEDMSGSADQHEEHSPSAVADRSPMLEISNAMVRLYKEAFGRGPTKARAQFAGPDTLVVMLESSLTGRSATWWRWASTSAPAAPERGRHRRILCRSYFKVRSVADRSRPTVVTKRASWQPKNEYLCSTPGPS